MYSCALLWIGTPTMVSRVSPPCSQDPWDRFQVPHHPVLENLSRKWMGMNVFAKHTILSPSHKGCGIIQAQHRLFNQNHVLLFCHKCFTCNVSFTQQTVFFKIPSACRWTLGGLFDKPLVFIVESGTTA